MKLEVDLYFKKPPVYSQVIELDETNLIEAKFQATEIVSKIAWYAGFKDKPKKVHVKQIF